MDGFKADEPACQTRDDTPRAAEEQYLSYCFNVLNIYPMKHRSHAILTPGQSGKLAVASTDTPPDASLRGVFRFAGLTSVHLRPRVFCSLSPKLSTPIDLRCKVNLSETLMDQGFAGNHLQVCNGVFVGYMWSPESLAQPNILAN